MLINNNFIYIHIEKTGGHWMREVLQHYRKFRPSFKGGHVPLSTVTAERHLSKPALCFVRNPWDWYVSLYEWKRLTIRQKRYEWAIPQPQWSQELWNTYNNFQKFETSVLNSGSFTESFHHFTDHDTIPLYPQRMEDGLAKGLISFLNRTKIPYSRDLITHTAVKGKVNENPHKHYSLYYTTKLRDFIAERDEELINRFKYTFS